MVPMCIRKQWSMALGLLIGSGLWACLPARAGAHVGSRVFPIPELTDEMLAVIQLDGDVHEWFDQIGEPALTSVDFLNTGKEQHDPADLDFRIWLAWHDEPARLYVAFVAADDSYVNTHTYEADNSRSSTDDMMSGFPDGNDGIVLGVDGDHSGGRGRERSISRERLAEASGNAQQYQAISRTPTGPILDDPRSRHKSRVFSWMTLPPYAEAAGIVAGEAPVFWSIELYVTPFDRREDLTSPEGSVVSDLSAGQIIGFAIGVYESDAGDAHDQLAELAPEVHAVGSDSRLLDDVFDSVADNFLDGLLLPAGAEPEDTSVESVFLGADQGLPGVGVARRRHRLRFHRVSSRHRT